MSLNEMIVQGKWRVFSAVHEEEKLTSVTVHTRAVSFARLHVLIQEAAMSSDHCSNRSWKYVSLLSLCIAALSPLTVSAADAGTGSYQQERAACTNGTSHQDRATCLREAAAARGEAKRGHLTESTSYDENALMRCNVLPPADRQDCAKRVHGQGIVSGSVQGGGVYRETTTTVIESPPPGMAPATVPVAPAPVYREPIPASPSGTMPR